MLPLMFMCKASDAVQSKHVSVQTCPHSQVFSRELSRSNQKWTQRVLYKLICVAHKRILHFIQDGHEICFVGDEAFRQLSAFDPNGNELLDKVLSPLSNIHLQRGCMWFIYNVCAFYHMICFFLRPWLLIRATNGLQNTKSRRRQCKAFQRLLISAGISKQQNDSLVTIFEFIVAISVCLALYVSMLLLINIMSTQRFMFDLYLCIKSYWKN